jgi:mevalonate kinase
MNSSWPKHKRNYPSKLLLFGEYTVLAASRSLAMPFAAFDLKIAQNSKNNFNGTVKEFYLYLKEQDFSEYALHFKDRSYRDFFEGGKYFASNIPIGYGVGSSGALTAAVYDLFFEVEKENQDRKELRPILAHIENFFHGQSSGTDPLISYLNVALLTYPDGHMEKVNIDASLFKSMQVHLLDSGISRSTADYVSIFRNKIKDPGYVKSVVEPLKKLNEAVIDIFIGTASSDNLFTLLKQISRIQFESFSEMIPPSIHDLWKDSLADPDCLMKLCGAGGGGFFYYFSRDTFDVTAAIPAQMKRIHIKR